MDKWHGAWLLALIAALVVGCTTTQAPAQSTPRPLSITEPLPGVTVASSPVMIRGTAPPGSRIVQDISFGPDQETAADGSGAWAMSVVLGAGDNTLTFRIGDDGDTAQSITIRLATSAVTAPPVTLPTATLGPIATVRPPTGTYETLTKRQWSQLVKAPDDHVGEQYVVWACITQFDAATGSDTFRGDAYFEKNGPYWFDAENSFFNGDEAELAEFVTDDVARMTVRVIGAYTYDTTIGGSTTVPAFFVDGIENRGSCQ